MEKIGTPSKTKEIIQANSFYFKKGFGQNFLIDFNILNCIVESAGVTEDDCVLEIGPGIGSLTQVLAEKARKVIAVEIDSKLIPILKDTLAEYENIKIIQEDILKLDIDALISQENEGKAIKVVANLPYYITTPIIMDLLENHRNVSSITVMIQKEVAERIQAKPGTKDYGALSVAVQYYCNVSMDLTVPPSCFMPQPKVASSVITLEVCKEPKVKVADEALFFHVVKCAFGQRRKTLLNGLYNQGQLNLSKEQITQLIIDIGENEKIRGEVLSLEGFARLSNAIYEVKEKSSR